jgi:hypothetical protein
MRSVETKLARQIVGIGGFVRKDCDDEGISSAPSKYYVCTSSRMRRNAPRAAC